MIILLLSCCNTYTKIFLNNSLLHSQKHHFGWISSSNFYYIFGREFWNLQMDSPPYKKWSSDPLGSKVANHVDHSFHVTCPTRRMGFIFWYIYKPRALVATPFWLLYFPFHSLRVLIILYMLSPSFSTRTHLPHITLASKYVIASCLLLHLLSCLNTPFLFKHRFCYLNNICHSGGKAYFFCHVIVRS